ncbi:MAG TPA: hypothetical protein VNJ71_09580 [Gemmatimonadales bacterium]|nr:hypothetical protein [Gemmatimonadales bacterium]
MSGSIRGDGSVDIRFNEGVINGSGQASRGTIQGPMTEHVDAQERPVKVAHED